VNGQSGIYVKLDPSTGKIQVFNAPRGPGLYSITTTPNDDVYYASLGGSYVGHINVTTGAVTCVMAHIRILSTPFFPQNCYPFL